MLGSTSRSSTIYNKSFWTNYVTTLWYEAGQKLNARVNEQAYEALKPQILPDRRPLLNITSPLVYWFDNSWNWGSRNTTNVSSTPPTEFKKSKKGKEKEETEQQKKEREEQEKAKQDRMNQWVGGITFIGGLAAIGITFKNLFRYYNAQKESGQIDKEVEGHCRCNDSPPQETDTYNYLAKFVKEVHAIDWLKYSKIVKYASVALGFTTGGAALAAAGFAKIGWLATAAKITIIVSLGVAAFTCAWHWNDEKEINQHYYVIAGKDNNTPSLAEQILWKFNFFNDTMVYVEPQNPPLPPCLYPDLYYSPPQPSAPPL